MDALERGVWVLERAPVLQPVAMPLVIRCQAPPQWARPLFVHLFQTQPHFQDTSWPGIEMQSIGEGWYELTLADLDAASIVFTDGHGNQTPDLRRERDGWYVPNRGWQDARLVESETPSEDLVRIHARFNADDAQEWSEDHAGPSANEEPDFREETIYFLITTRFYDGCPEQDFWCRDRIEFDQRGNPVDPHWRGDFKGLIERLDYIKELGFSAIWITPPIENRSGLDYHGYHGYDWTRIDPRLESDGATYQDLIDAMHARCLKLIQDVVVNHSCQYGIRGQVHIDHLPVKYYVPQGSEQGRIKYGPYQGNLGNYRFADREDIDNPLAPQWYRERVGRDPEGREPLVDPKTGVTVPCPGYNPGRFFGVDCSNLDPTWYHQAGFIAGGDWESASLQVKHIAGDCIDLNTEHPTVKRYLIESINRYLDMGVDALRIDTVKHVERDNLLEYVNAWKQHKPGLFVFGENLVKGTGYGDLFGTTTVPRSFAHGGTHGRGTTFEIR